jgi:glycosyltransferase involved in cell wall biosynthesis
MISIVMPVYNTHPDWLSQSIDSCLNQTFKDFELIIVDNESTKSSTLNKLENYKNNDKIKILKCPKQSGKRGVSLALNMGIEHSKYELIARMDSDDWMKPVRLQKQYDYMMHNPDVSILGTQIKILQTKQITSHPEIVDIHYIKNTKSSWFINHPTVMFRKNIFNVVDKYAESPEIFPEDLELWTRCLLKNLKIRNLKDCLLNYNFHGKNTSIVDATQIEWRKNLNSYINRIV